MTQKPRIGIVSVSDRASRGEYQDRGGPAVQDFLTRVLADPWEPEIRVVADERTELEALLVELVDREGCCLVVTTGGTGVSERDVTPEATAAVVEKLIPGIGERMRAIAVDRVPTAMLSRQVAGIRGQALIFNLPGSPKAIDECLAAVFPAVPHCLELIGGPALATRRDVLESYDPRHE